MKDHAMIGTSDKDRSAESRRILDRVSRESDSSAFGFVNRTAERARSHLAADDASQTDRIELWGTRIGRAIAAIFLCALILWALSILASGT